MIARAHLRSGTLAVIAALAAATGLTADTLAMGGKPVRSVHGVDPSFHGRGQEGLVVEILRDIAENRLASAHERLDQLLATTPNFRLAQLIKGDLLMARVKPLAELGDAAEAPGEQLAGLREEAKARLERVRTAPPADGRIPQSVLRLSGDQKYAIVVDTDRSTLYMFENMNGTPRYVSDYYVTIGRNGIEKAREGDKRTPVGVYHVTANLPREKLSDFYGAGAYPISYPNEWDQRNGRSGHGIWLHGTPRDTYSRPPRASDGCVVLTNEDLQSIGKFVQVGVTPVIITNRIDWVGNEEVAATRSSLESAIERWRTDWESRDADRYLSHYSRSFSTGTMGIDAWARQKRSVNGAKQWIKVGLDDMSLFLYPGQQPLAVSTFTQDYRSNNLTNVMKKRVYWIREGTEWKIIHEGAA